MIQASSCWSKIWASNTTTNHSRQHVNLPFQYLYWTGPQTESGWSLGYATIHLPHTVWSLCVHVCVPGLQGAGNSSYRHHIPHRFLLLCQLCESWHSGDAGARLFWLPSRGKTPHMNFNLRDSFIQLCTLSWRKGKEEMHHYEFNLLTCNALKCQKHGTKVTGNLTWIQPLCIYCGSFHSLTP